MTDSTKIMESIEKVRFNPTEIQRVVLQALEEMTNGEVKVVNASNPFVFSLESAAVIGAAGMMENEALNRKQYASLALTWDDLYLHMSDADFIGVFANPSSTTFTVLMSKDEIKKKAIDVGLTGTKKLTIPRHTEFSISDTQFTMQYPIDIRVMAHGGLTITYDVDKPSPFKTLETNVVDWYATTIGGIDFIAINVPVDQLKLKSYNEVINKASGFKKSFKFTDQFYHARAFIKDALGVWKEIKTTHTEQVYDPLVPTVALKVLSDSVSVIVPQIYLSTDQISGTLRIDVYSTKGNIEMSLEDYQIGEFKANWLDYDEDDKGKYYSPLNTFSAMSLFSDKKVTGGGNGLTFDQLRERVIMNSLGDQDIPITNAQIETSVSNLGFDIVKNLDVVTNRQFLATRNLPNPPESDGVSPAAATMLLLQSTFNNLAGIDTVKSNGNRLTILPKTVYRNTTGVIDIVPTGSVNAIKALPTDEQAAAVNNDNLLFSPFHYIFDINNDEFETRAYMLDNPKVISKLFYQENDTSLLQVSIAAYQLITDGTDTGFFLDMVTISNEAFKEISTANVKVQISYIPSDSNDRVYMTTGVYGSLPDGELMFRFHITTDYDIDNLDQMIVKSFKVFDDSVRTIPIDLKTMLDCVVIVSNHEPIGLVNSAIDNIVAEYYLPVATRHIGVTHEKVNIRFGDRLKWLWTRSRSVMSQQLYQTYPADEFAVYTERVYLRGLDGNIVITWNAIAEEVEYTLIHEIGDPVLNVTGQAAWDAYLLANPGTPILTWWATLTQPVKESYWMLAHNAGDTILDGQGDPIPLVTPRDIDRQSDLFLIDGKYYFATAEESINYKRNIAEFVTQWIVDDIQGVADNLIEQTEVYYYPKNTVGSINVIVGEGVATTLRAEQSLAVTYHVNSDTYGNQDLREVIENTTPKVISERLARGTVSLDDIQDMLREAMGANIISVKVTGLFAEIDADTATVKDSSARFILGKRLVALPDETLGVEDAISVSFIRHIA